MTRSSRSNPVLIDLALQGGGSHGAFTWGVLDRLLEEDSIRIAGISGTSAGAMNAAVLADGWTEGGADAARAALERFWVRVSQAAALSPLQRSPLDRLMGRWSLDTSPAYVAMDLMSRVFSPYDLNLLGPGKWRGSPLGANAYASNQIRPACDLRRFVEAQRRVGFHLGAARRKSARGKCVSGQAWR
jgi:hypothetical protein